MIMMPYGWRWSSLQLTGQADFWHPIDTPAADPARVRDPPQSAPPAPISERSLAAETATRT